ncbi:MAG: hypothetical protein ACQEXV_05865 [Bacillota bacterium]
MSKKEMIRALRDPEFRKQFEDFSHPSGVVSEDELKQVVGGAELTPNSIVVTLGTGSGCKTYYVCTKTNDCIA